MILGQPFAPSSLAVRLNRKPVGQMSFGCYNCCGAALRYEAYVDRRVQILVEGPSKRPERMMGRTRCGKIVVFDGSDRHRGQLMDVQVTRAGNFTLYGDPAVVGME